MTETAKILVVDDDGHIREVVRFALENAGYQATEAADGEQALTLFESSPFDLLVLDIVMPGIDGLAVCREIRKTKETPIIFLSSKDEELDKILGLEMGADDYIAKPFSPRELVTRIKTVLRRYRRTENSPHITTSQQDLISYGQLTLDLSRHVCKVDNQPITLTVTEFSLLLVLAKSPGRVYTRDQLVEAAYGAGHAISDRTVDSHVRRIRKKLMTHDADLIETVYGLGYKMREI